MQRHFEQIEEELKDRLLYMGSLAEEMIARAVQALVERKRESLAKVHTDEEQVNRLHIEIDERCLKLLALYQPAAADLRFIVACVKINADLERIADQAVNIAQTTDVLLGQPLLERKLLGIPRMAQVARGMLKDSLDAVVKKDPQAARSVVARDEEEDHLKSEAFRDLLSLMQSDPACIQRALGLILISRNLERIADHATNIAEDVIFMALGKDIRHHNAR
ncbi:MAG: phosphate signaling complex protein PhoU [Elusimicrobiota bacterium]